MNAIRLTWIAAVALAVIVSPGQGQAQPMQNARCSFWLDGKPLGDEACRTSWQNGRIQSINYLAGEIPGRGNPETISAWQEDWVPGKMPECLINSIGYAICQK